MFVNYCYKGPQAIQVGSHRIEASYITVHSYNITPCFFTAVRQGIFDEINFRGLIQITLFCSVCGNTFLWIWNVTQYIIILKGRNFCG